MTRVLEEIGRKSGVMLVLTNLIHYIQIFLYDDQKRRHHEANRKIGMRMEEKYPYKSTIFQNSNLKIKLVNDENKSKKRRFIYTICGTWKISEDWNVRIWTPQLFLVDPASRRRCRRTPRNATSINTLAYSQYANCHPLTEQPRYCAATLS